MPSNSLQEQLPAAQLKGESQNYGVEFFHITTAPGNKELKTDPLSMCDI